MEPDKKNNSDETAIVGDRANGKATKNDRDKWVSSFEHLLEYILKNEQSQQASLVLEQLNERLRDSGIQIPQTVSTPRR